MREVTDAFNRATTATYALRNDPESTMRKNEATAAVRDYATVAGMDVFDAIMQVTDWVNEAFPVDQFPIMPRHTA